MLVSTNFAFYNYKLIDYNNKLSTVLSALSAAYFVSNTT